MNERFVDEVASKYMYYATPQLQDRQQYSDLTDEQYQLMDRFRYIVYTEFREVLDEDGQPITPGESRYLWLHDLQPEISQLPDVARVGMLGFAIFGTNGAFAEDYNAATDIEFMQNYFAVSDEAIHDLAEFYLEHHRTPCEHPEFGLLQWISKAFPDILPHDQLVNIFRQEKMLQGVGKWLSSWMYHDAPEAVDAVVKALEIPIEYVQCRAWNAFIENKKPWITSDWVEEHAFEEIISAKYLCYFLDRTDLAREVEKTRAEFTGYLQSDENIARPEDYKYKDAIKFMEAIIKKCLQVDHT